MQISIALYYDRDSEMDSGNMKVKVGEKCGNELFTKEVLKDLYEYWCSICLNFISIENIKTQ